MQFDYQAEKLSEARRHLMLPHSGGEECSIVDAFDACEAGLSGVETEDVNQFLDDSARDWIKVIKGFMSTKAIEDSKGEGAWHVKARTLSTEDKIQLSRCVDELANWFDRYEYDRIS